MIKYSIVECRYDKILVNVAAYVITPEQRTTHTHTHTLTRNYIFGLIYQDFTITTYYYVVFYHFNIS